MQPITALTIAGSDSGGGAGVQGDCRTFGAFGLHATTALTAITAQNTLGVSAIVNLDPDIVEAQVRAVVSDFSVAATKTGMLACARTVERVSTLAAEGQLAHLIVDPVLVSTTGHVLMEEGGVEAYRHALFPFAEVVTPNLHEAAVLCDVDRRDVKDIDDMEKMARMILAMGPRFVLVKGGHLTHSPGTARAPDLLIGRDDLFVLDSPRIDTTNDHGTGCALSAALAAGLALGRDVVDAARDAKSFVLAALSSSADWRVGHGRGPIDHFGWNE